MSDEYEWVPLRLPPEVTRLSASTRLSIEAEYRGWELTRVRLYADGRYKPTHFALPEMRKNAVQKVVLDREPVPDVRRTAGR